MIATIRLRRHAKRLGFAIRSAWTAVLLVAAGIVIFSNAAHASEAINLQPFYPSPYTQKPFSLPAYCHVQSLAADGNFQGVCGYYGGDPKQGLSYAVVEWSTAGVAQSATPCTLYVTCPAETYGPFEYLDNIPVFVQAKDPVTGNTAVIKDYTPRTSAIITP